MSDASLLMLKSCLSVNVSLARQQKQLLHPSIRSGQLSIEAKAALDSVRSHTAKRELAERNRCRSVAKHRLMSNNKNQC